MNAKCAAAANRMLNEVEMTGAWLLGAPLKPWHTNSTLSILATQGQWRNGGTLHCAVCKAVKLIEPTTK